MYEKEAKESFIKRYPNNSAINTYYTEGFKDGYNKAKEDFAVQLKEVVETCNHWQEVLARNCTSEGDIKWLKA